MVNYFKNYFRSDSFIRYLITIIAAPIAVNLGFDAAQTQSFTQWIIAFVVGLLTFAPAVWSQISQPSKMAMPAAVAADKIVEGESTTITKITTPAGIPNILVKPEPRTRSNQG